MATPGRTLYQKICDAHTVDEIDREHVLLYVDRHILNEYTSPQAFTGLREAGRRVLRPAHTFAVTITSIPRALIERATVPIAKPANRCATCAKTAMSLE